MHPIFMSLLVFLFASTIAQAQTLMAPIPPGNEFQPELLNGKLDMLLRAAGGAHLGLHVDRLVLVDANGTQTPVVLLTQPGLAGCREHRRLIRRLQG